MKKLYILLTFLLLSISSFGQTAFISEIHATNGIEVTDLIGESLNNYTINVYGTFGTVLSGSPFTLSGTIPSGDPNSTTHGALNFTGILNGGWSNFVGRTIVLLYNGVQTGNAVTYGGVTFLPSGVSNIVNAGSSVPSGGLFGSNNSLQLTDTGWFGPTTPSQGTVNPGLTTLSVVKNNIEGFKMYPNPVSNGQLNITSNSWADKQVEIYNMNGQQVYNKIVKHREVIEINNLNKGIYVIRIIEENKIATRKLLVN